MTLKSTILTLIEGQCGHTHIRHKHRKTRLRDTFHNDRSYSKGRQNSPDDERTLSLQKTCIVDKHNKTFLEDLKGDLTITGNAHARLEL
jgi:hypothetical protein